MDVSHTLEIAIYVLNQLKTIAILSHFIYDILIHNVKSMLKISSIFMTFLENMNFNCMKFFYCNFFRFHIDPNMM